MDVSLNKKAFTVGTYKIRHPFCLIIKPTIRVFYSKKGKKLKAEFQWLGYKKKFDLVKEREAVLVFQCYMDIVHVDLVLHFYKPTAFEGIVDTPLGHLRFTGHMITSQKLVFEEGKDGNS